MRNIDREYYSVSPKGRQLCLNCPLVECVHMPGAISGDVCPVDGHTVPGPDQYQSALTDRQVAITSQIKELMAAPDDSPPLVGEIVRRLRVSRSTLNDWALKGLIQIEKKPSPHTPNARLLYVTGVNV